MFVPSPFIDYNGEVGTSKLSSLRFNAWVTTEANARRFATFLEQSMSGFLAHTRRGGLQNGVLGYKRYRDTYYLSGHRSVTQDGYLTNIGQLGASSNWTSETIPIFIGGGHVHLSGSSFANQVALPSPSNLVNGIAITNLRNRALMEAKQKALQRKLDLAESLTGIPKTVQMVARSASTVIRAWRNVRSGNYMQAARQLGLNRRTFRNKDLASIWLELQYGWLPLLSDIFNGVQEVNRLLSDQTAAPVHFTVTRRARTGLTLFQNPTEWSGFGGGVQMTDSYAIAEVEVKYRLRIRDANLAYLSGLGITNPLYIVWIAVPFSFVVDWLVPIGDWLDGMSAPLGLDFASGYMSTRTSADVTLKAESTNGRLASYARQYTTRDSFGKAVTREQGTFLERLPQVGFPGLLPYIHFPLGSNERIANASALIISTRKLR